MTALAFLAVAGAVLLYVWIGCALSAASAADDAIDAMPEMQTDHDSLSSQVRR